MKFSSLRKATKFKGRIELFNVVANVMNCGTSTNTQKRVLSYARLVKQRTIDDSLSHKLPNGVIGQINGAH